MSGKITLNIVTGFLGAGKTTFVQAMLRELNRRQGQEQQDGVQNQPNSKLGQANGKPGQPSGKVVYVVNEFGQAGVDQSILAGQSVLSYELANGCICCSLKAEFSTMLQQIIHDHQPERIIFEPSGLFILSELITSLSGETFSENLQIGSIVTLLDARHQLASARTFSPLLQNQARLADLLILSKLQSRPDFGLDQLADLQLEYPGQPILTRDVWDFTADEWRLVLDQKPRSLHQMHLKTARTLVRHQLFWTRQHQQLDSLSVRWTLQATKTEIHTALTELVNGQCGEIIRCKGFIDCDGQHWLVQIVRDQIDWHPAPAGEAQRLVIIGEHLQVDRISSLLGGNKKA